MTRRVGGAWGRPREPRSAHFASRRRSYYRSSHPQPHLKPASFAIPTCLLPGITTQSAVPALTQSAVPAAYHLALDGCAPRRCCWWGAVKEMIAFASDRKGLLCHVLLILCIRWFMWSCVCFRLLPTTIHYLLLGVSQLFMLPCFLVRTFQNPALTAAGDKHPGVSATPCVACWPQQLAT